VCSPRCRAQRWRQDSRHREEALLAPDREVRELLEATGGGSTALTSSRWSGRAYGFGDGVRVERPEERDNSSRCRANHASLDSHIKHAP